MALAEIDRLNGEIKIIYPTNQNIKKITEWEQEINNYPIKIIPQNTITSEQMKLLYVLFKQYGEEIGYTMLEMKEVLKEEFGFEYELGYFSLSPYKKNPLTLELATEFIQWIIEHALENNVNLYILDRKNNIQKHIREIVPDIQRYVIKCIKERICCVCGKKHDVPNGKIVDLEHYDNVNTIGGYEFDDGLKTRFLTLCREHHQQIHNLPKEEFLKKYILEAVYLNPKIVFEILKTYPNHFKLFRKRLKEGYYKNLQEV